ncbi:MAG: hypothetical protein ACE5NN_06080, partial [Candidatus Bathyarchaeia archaeon]
MDLSLRQCGMVLTSSLPHFSLCNDKGRSIDIPARVTGLGETPRMAEEMSVGDPVEIRNIFVRNDQLCKLRLSFGMLTSLDYLAMNKDPNWVTPAFAGNGQDSSFDFPALLLFLC